MTYHVKEAFEVEVNYVLIFIHYLLCSPQSITPPLLGITVICFRKLTLV